MGHLITVWNLVMKGLKVEHMEIQTHQTSVMRLVSQWSSHGVILKQILDVPLIHSLDDDLVFLRQME